jgi:hypothetical protein
MPLTGPLGIEAAALYKRFGFDTAAGSGAFTGPFVSVVSSTTGNAWEFPIAVKARLRLPRGIVWFAGAGPSIRRLTGITERGERTVQTFFPSPTRAETSTYETDSPLGMNRRTSFGAAVSAGLEFRAGRLAFAPLVRLTRWDSERTSNNPSPSRINRTQVDALLRVAYVAGAGRESAARAPCCFGFGAHLGLGLLDTFQRPQPPTMFTTLDAPTRRIAPGAFVEWRFHSRFSVEAGFLVRRFSHAQTDAFPGFVHTDVVSGDTWEAPLLIKWRPFRLGSAAAIVGGGPALRRASHVEWITTSNGASVPLDAAAIGRSAAGFALSGGLEFATGGVGLRPEFRYLRFERTLYDFGYLRTRSDSAYLMLAVGWLGRG